MSAGAQAEPQTIGEIASTVAGACAVFYKRRIDFSCGGADSLDEAALKSGADPVVVRGELDALDRKPPDVPSDSAALRDYIVERYHDAHRRETPELIGLARRVEAAHHDHPEAPGGLADALEASFESLLDHFRLSGLDLRARYSVRSPSCVTSTIIRARKSPPSQL